MTRKVFGIGLNKTGTTTLGTCLKHLGYDHVSVRADLMADWAAGRFDRIFTITDAHDSFEDWPWPLMYRELAERYPDARFILTQRRSAKAWLASLEKHALRRTGLRGNPRKLAYGYLYPHYARQAHLDYYARHQSEVIAHFKAIGALDRLQVLCWESGDGWETLCSFLNQPHPQIAFPHERRAKEDRLTLRRVLNTGAMLLAGAAYHASAPLRPQHGK